MLGIIGGSGLDQLPGLEITERRACASPYGKPSADLVFGRLHGRELIFLPRHGVDHSVAPHHINYRANLWALHAQGVRNVVAVSTVGGITKQMVAGALVVPSTPEALAARMERETAAWAEVVRAAKITAG